MPQLWKWFCDARKSLIIAVILFLAGGPLIAIGVLDHWADAILAGIFAIFVSLLDIRSEWDYFCWQQKRRKRQGDHDGWLEYEMAADSLPAAGPVNSGTGPRFTYDLDSGNHPTLIQIPIPFLAFVLPHILISAKHFITATIIALDIAAIVCVLCLVLIAYIRAR